LVGLEQEAEQRKNEEPGWVLTGLDRCDACGAQAYVRVTGVTGSLDFCGHHYKINETKLAQFAFEIIDERERLIENKSKGEDY
jgi:hypothetical protein